MICIFVSENAANYLCYNQHTVSASGYARPKAMNKKENRFSKKMLFKLSVLYLLCVPNG